MRYLLLLLLVGCIDSSMDTEVNTVVYQFADVTVGDTIPSTSLVWSTAHVEEVRRTVSGMRFACCGWKLSVQHCNDRRNDRENCFATRMRALATERDRYIRELQILGVW